MTTKTLIVIAIVLMAVVQIACAASANVGSPTPQPAPTAAPPQVIVVQQSAPAPVSHDDNGVLIAALIGAMAAVVLVTGISIGYIARSGNQQPQANSVPQSLTLTTHNYYTTAPTQLTPFEQYQLLREQGFASQQANQIVSEGRAHQYLLPPGQ